MRPDRIAPFAPRGQCGFAIMAALIILVVLASLGAYMATISSSQHVGSALDIQGSRALQVARAGMDWGVARAVNAPAVFGAGSCQPGPVSVNLSTGAAGDFPGFTGFAVTVTCAGTAYTDGIALFSYTLTVTACNQPDGGGGCPNAAPGANYVERRLTTQVVCNAAGIC